MPIRSFLAGKSFDPETLANLEAAFECACADLGVSENDARHSREIVAKKVIEQAGRQRHPQAIRAAVVASLASKHQPS
jgi:hypothetical protein